MILELHKSCTNHVRILAISTKIYPGHGTSSSDVAFISTGSWKRTVKVRRKEHPDSDQLCTKIGSRTMPVVEM